MSDLGIDLLDAGLVPPLPRAFLEGRDLDLLSPLGFAAPTGELPGPLSGRPPETPGRGELAAALATANAGYGHPAAEAMAAKLADPGTRVVATGQLAGRCDAVELQIRRTRRFVDVIEPRQPKGSQLHCTRCGRGTDRDGCVFWSHLGRHRL